MRLNKPVLEIVADKQNAPIISQIDLNQAKLKHILSIRQDSHKVSGISQSDPGVPDLRQTPRSDQLENQAISNSISDKNQRGSKMPQTSLATDEL